MKILIRFGSFWYHFIVGDDWRIAIAVVTGLSVTALLTYGYHLQVWWLLPVLTITILSLSLWLAGRNR